MFLKKKTKEIDLATLCEQHVTKTCETSEQIKERIDTLWKRDAELLPCEDHAKEQIRAEIKRLEAEQIPNRMDMSFMGMTMKAKGGPLKILPRFAMYPVGAHQCKINLTSTQSQMRIQPSIWGSVRDRLHEMYKCAYGPYLDHMNSLSKWSRDYELSHKFVSVIPDETRAKIKEARRGDTFDEVVIVQEATQWNVETPPPRRDPLVLGWISATESFYLIDRFDTTTVEEYVAREFKS